MSPRSGLLSGTVVADMVEGMEPRAVSSRVLLVTPDSGEADDVRRALKQLDPNGAVQRAHPNGLRGLELSSFDAVVVDGRGEDDALRQTLRELRAALSEQPLLVVVRPRSQWVTTAVEAGADECCARSAEALRVALERARARRRAAASSARSMREEHERARQLRLRRHNEALRALAKQLEHKDLERRLKVITEAAAESLEVTRASVWLFDDARAEIRVSDLFDRRTTEHSKGIVLSTAEYPEYFRALSDERVILANDAREHPATRCFAKGYLEPLDIVSILDAPIRVGDRLLGVICHEQVGRARRFTDEDASLAGSFADFVALAIESHEHQRAEEALKSSKVQLDDARRIEAVGRLASGVAHDFNNVITVVSSYAFLLARKLDRNDALQGPVAEIGKAAERAADITRKLLALSRRDPVAPRVFDLNVVVRGMETFLKRLIGEHITLELSLSKVPLLLKADPGQIEQIVLNLVVNARDAAGPDGSTVTVRTYRDSDSRRENQELPCVLEVVDTGIGMSPEVQARIFEPFFTTKEVGRGSGLGLFTVWGTVSQMNGHIDVESAPNQGSRFVLRFAEAAPEARTQVGGADRAALMGNETILLVEDELQLREVTALILKDLGYRVLEASNIDQAVAHARVNRHIDLLLSDIVMPKASGPVVAAKLREIIPSLRVLFMSGYNKDMLSAYDASLGPTMAKPFTAEQVGQKVRELLDGKEPLRLERPRHEPIRN